MMVMKTVVQKIEGKENGARDSSLFFAGIGTQLQSILQRSGRTSFHLGSDFVNRRMLRLDPTLSPYIKHQGQPAHAYTRMDAYVRIKGHRDFRRLI